VVADPRERSTAEYLAKEMRFACPVVSAPRKAEEAVVLLDRVRREWYLASQISTEARARTAASITGQTRRALPASHIKFKISEEKKKCRVE
jgi:hypothetical protein